MNTGRLPETIRKRTVLKQIGHRQDAVLSRPGIGRGGCRIGEDGKTQSICCTYSLYGRISQIGYFGFYGALNRVLACGGRPVGITADLWLPESIREIKLKNLVKILESLCEQHGIDLMDMEVHSAAVVSSPLLHVSAYAENVSDARPCGLLAGDDLVMTGYMATEGALRIVEARSSELEQRLPVELLDSVRETQEEMDISVEADCLWTHVQELELHAVMPLGEGGVFGGLWEIGEAGGTGIDADLQKIPVRQETIEVCEVFGLNPYQLLSGGALLIGTPSGNQLVDLLRTVGVPAVVIGRATSGNDRILRNEAEIRYLEPADTDEIYKILD